MRKWIIRSVLICLACTIAEAGWVFYVWLWPNIRYQRAHHTILEKTTQVRLDALVQQAAAIAGSLGPSEIRTFYRDNKTMPNWAADLDPTWVSINRDQAMVELCGGFDHYGFVLRRSEKDPDEWTIFRYDESDEVQVRKCRYGPAPEKEATSNGP